MKGKRLLPSFLVPCVVVVMLLVSLQHAAAQSPDNEIKQPGRLTAAVDWLISTHQNSDGGFSAFSGGADLAPSDVGGTVDAVLAIAAAGYNPDAPAPGRENAPLDYLTNNPDAVATYAAIDGSTAGKLVLALTAAGKDPRNFLGYNFVISLTNHISPTGQFGVDTAFQQSLAILALNGVENARPTPEAVAWLLEAQETEGELAGSWDDGFGTAGNADATAMAMMALSRGLDPEDPAMMAAREFLSRTQLQTGGWEYGPGFGANANSTALVIQALSALGEDFYSSESEWAVEAVSPLAALFSWQGESGAFQVDFGDGPSDDFFTTVQAIPGLAGKPYPLPGRVEAARQAITCLATLQDPVTGGWESFPGSGVDAGGTARAIEAIAAFGHDPADEDYTVNGNSPMDALALLTPDYLVTGRGGRVGNVLQGVVAGGGNPTDFATYNLVISATNYLSPTGEYDSTDFGPFAHNQTILGLLAAGTEVDETAISWLIDAQVMGGWGDADGTAGSVQVLAQLDRPVDAALSYLRSLQLADGGWGFGDTSSPSSTSEVAQALVLAGENPFAPGWSVVVSGTVQNPADAVLALQGADGCWPNAFGPGNDPFSTVDGIMMLVLDPPFEDLSVTETASETIDSEESGSTIEAEPEEETTPVPAETPDLEQTATIAPPTEPTETIASTTTQEPVAGTNGEQTIEPDATTVASGENDAESEEVISTPEVEPVDEETEPAVNPLLAWVLVIAAVVAVILVAIGYRGRS